MDKKVSIITPCFNGEKYIERFLNSILYQTYPILELIVVNDGSNDKTENIILSYEELFKNRGYELIYLFQPNSGQAAALNKGLKIFSGEYLTWPDSDDYLNPRSIEKKVFFLEENPKFGFVRSDAYLFSEEDLSKSVGYVSKKKSNRFKDQIFDDLISEETYCTDGCYMIRTSSFFEVNPAKEIYISRGGQNWQMLLPIAYKYRCGYIDEPLYNCVIRNNSHSHIANSKELLLERCNEHEDILKNIVFTMIIDTNKYNRIISEKYLHRRLTIAGIFMDKFLAKECYMQITELGCSNCKDRLSYLLAKNKLFNILIRGFFLIPRIVEKYFKIIIFEWK